MDIEENVRRFLDGVPERNPYGEKVTVVAAVKTQTADAINAAVAAGVKDIGDNHVQEFREKYDLIRGCPNRHFIGHLQTNKIKYLLGRTYLYQSADRLPLIEELNEKSEAAGVVSDILLQINAGGEETKGGFSFDEVYDAYRKAKNMPALRVRGVMAMLPDTDDEKLLRTLATKVRKTYDDIAKDDGNADCLSMGMSGDWRICVECGSNMIRIGTALFGERK